MNTRRYWLPVNAHVLQGKQGDGQDSEAHDKAYPDFAPLLYLEFADYHDWNEGTEEIGKADERWTMCQCAQVSMNFRSSPPRPLFASARTLGEMQCPWIVGFHTFPNGMHWKHITNRNARVPSILMTMKAMITFDSLRFVPLMMRRMNKHTEVLISPVAIVACISAMVVHLAASDSVDSTYIVCLPNPRCICLEFVTPPKIQTTYV